MGRLDDRLRSFGMSAMLVAEELRSVENRFGIGIGYPAQQPRETAAEFYPQFEHAIRSDAARMASHYRLFYCLENSIRSLIAETMSDAAGAGWWDARVPGPIRSQVDENIRKEEDSGFTRRSENRIDYTTFGQLGEIIKSNWESFETVVSNRRALEKVLATLNVLRGPIAHCCPLADDEVRRLGVAVADWFRLLS